MCLSIHPDQPSPLVAKRDIVVWKVLVMNESPYRNCRYTFGIKKRSVRLGIRSFDWEVHEGYHSFRTKEKGRIFGCRATALPAIIPRGSKVMFGLSDEVVSSSLIVYESMAALERVHGKVAKPVSRKELLK